MYNNTLLYRSELCELNAIIEVICIHFTRINGYLCKQAEKLNEFWMLVLIVEAL